MVEDIVRKTSKKTWYKWSFYLNIILFFLIAIFLYFVVKDVWTAGIAKGSGVDTTDEMFALARDLGVLAVLLALQFFQFFRNLFVIMRRSL
jgi:hypothetical protein